GRNTTMRGLPAGGGPISSAIAPRTHNTLAAIAELTSTIDLRTLPPDPLNIVSSPLLTIQRRRSPCVVSCASPRRRIIRSNLYPAEFAVDHSGRPLFLAKQLQPEPQRGSMAA